MSIARNMMQAAAGAGGAEFLYDDNFEAFLIGEVTINVDDVFSSPTDADQNPLVYNPQPQFENPTTGYVKQKSQAGSYVFRNENRMFLTFEDEISNVDVSAVVDIDFDAQSYTTLINDSDWANAAPSNLRYIEGSRYFFISRGQGNSPLGYDLTAGSTFAWTPFTTASNSPDSRFYDPTLNSLHESCYTTNSTTYDLWTFQNNSTSVLSEDVSSYIDTSVGTSFRHWSPVYMDDSYVYWFDSERTGYSAKGASNSTPVSGYTILASSTGVSNNLSNGDTWAFGYTNAYCDIWNNTYVQNTNSNDANYRLYRRLHHSGGTPTFTTWEDPLSSLRPSGGYAQFADIYSAGTADYQVARITVSDGSTTTSDLYKMTDTSTFDGPYTYPILTDWSLSYINAKTIFARQIVDDKTIKVRLYRCP